MKNTVTMTRRRLLGSIVAGLSMTNSASAEDGVDHADVIDDHRDVGIDPTNLDDTAHDLGTMGNPQSLRDIAEWMDHEAPAKRLYGNGPPFDPDRPDDYVGEPLFRKETVDSDDGTLVSNPPDPPDALVVNIRVDLANLYRKVLYGSPATEGDPSKPVFYLDVPDPKISFNRRGNKSYADYNTASGFSNAPDREFHVGRQSLVTADLNAYDLGMVNRTPDNAFGPAGSTNKGIVESHRWVDPADKSGSRGSDSDNAPEYRSLRNVVDRHREGVRHRMLWQNARLPKVRKPHYHEFLGWGSKTERAKAWGEFLGRNDFDIVGMCEIHKPELLSTMGNRYKDFRPNSQWRYGKQSLDDYGAILGPRDDENVVERTFSSFDSEEFNDTGPFPSNINKEGWMRFVVEVPELDGDPKFEVYLAHLQGLVGTDSLDRKQRTKLKQLRELTSVIDKRSSDHSERPKIVMGDFNVQSASRNGDLDSSDGIAKGQYFPTFMHLMKEVGMQEAWLTHGGPGPKGVECNRESDGYTCDSFDPGGDSYESYYSNNRLDYVFVEKPKDDHKLHLDVSRMKMIGARSDGNYLSDHAGIAFDLLTSPAT